MNTKITFAGLALPFIFIACDSASTATGTVPPGPKGTQLCADVNPLFPSRFLPDDTDKEDVIRDIVADGADVFFRTYKAAYRVPAAGGEPVRLDAEKPGQYVKSLHKVGSRIYLYSKRDNNGVLQELPRTGTATTTLAAPIAPAAGQTEVDEALFMDETHLYFLATKLIDRDDGSGRYSAYFLDRMPWAGGATEQLVSLDSARIGKLFKQGDRLYYGRLTGASFWNQADAIFSLPASGGTPIMVNALSGPQTLVDIFAADDASLYLNIIADPTLIKSGVSKVPLAGGTPTLLIDGKVDAIWLDAGRAIYTEYHQVKTDSDPLANWATGIYTVPVAGGAAAYTGCIPEGLGSGTFGVQSATFSGGVLYLGTTSNDDGKNTIIKYAVP
ncbi:MAG: hypothetical protein JF616_20260 [Fibrobacteres bacterium]|nr:hypothetical protein [Fibrobacterota bacterium]